MDDVNRGQPVSNFCNFLLCRDRRVPLVALGTEQLEVDAGVPIEHTRHQSGAGAPRANQHDRLLQVHLQAKGTLRYWR